MNTIILLMWLADILEKLQVSLILIPLIGGFAIFIMMMEGMKVKGLLISMLCCIVLLVILPSKQTIHGYIALYAGKEIVDSSIGQKGLKALESVLDSIINEHSKEKKNET